MSTLFFVTCNIHPSTWWSATPFVSLRSSLLINLSICSLRLNVWLMCPITKAFVLCAVQDAHISNWSIRRQSKVLEHIERPNKIPTDYNLCLNSKKHWHLLKSIQEFQNFAMGSSYQDCIIGKP